MTFKQRLPYFLFGSFLGIIIAYFIFSKKNATFDYGPNARVLKNIRKKPLIYSAEALHVFNSMAVDSAQVSEILKTGDVDIWNKVKQDTCIIYDITGEKELKNIILTVKNCDSTALIEKIIIQ